MGALTNGCNKDGYVLAFDTANEVIACALGRMDVRNRRIVEVASIELAARRASNTKLLPTIDALCKDAGVARSEIASVCVGRGPGSFTGVRIALATAKGIACALEVPLVGVSSIDAVAWNTWHADVRGSLQVIGDAMRKEVYPVSYVLSDHGVQRLTSDRVVKASEFAQNASRSDYLSGDGLSKYEDIVGHLGSLRPVAERTPTGQGLLSALQSDWKLGKVDPLDSTFDPAILLPVYTRLSDAEEAERARLAQPSVQRRDLVSGVQGGIIPSQGSDIDATEKAEGERGAATISEIEFSPLSAASAQAIAELENFVMGSDAWSASMVADELGRKDRLWWMASFGGALVGYAGALVVDGDMQILKVAVDPDFRRSGIAWKLCSLLASDAVNLAAETASLEVRLSNTGARAFYGTLGLKDVGVRPHYYSDGEDAMIMKGDISSLLPSDVAGIALARHSVSTASKDHDDHMCSSSDSALKRPLILAIETSCDETAASVIAGDEKILSDVVASQIDFHARFGGVVPEIASRKHIEAIVGVCDVALEDASNALFGDAGEPKHDDVYLRYRDMDAVACTYAPGLVGALVVGVAFAKGIAWGADIAFIGVNHLEGHLYANKLASETFAPPAVVSLVSGGNTMLVYMRDWGDYDILGTTIDDAVGEAFDKVAKALGLPYPGGPAISKLASEGDPASIDLPRAMLHSGDYRFSLSGLKTAVVTSIDKLRDDEGNISRRDAENVCASFQQAVIDVQVAKASRALEETGAPRFCLGGGVAANPALRKAYEKMCEKRGVELFMPPVSVCGDNAAMIALVALDRYCADKFFGLDADAYAHADLHEKY